MKKTYAYVGTISILESLTEKIVIDSTKDGIKICRGNHADMFISFQDLIELLDGQGLIKV